MPQTISPESTSNTTRVLAPRFGSKAELEALLTSVVTAPLPDTGWIKVTGPDRVRWLNGMVTNSVGDLASGQGCYNFLLNAQGRIQGDGYVFAQTDHLLFETGRSQLAPLVSLLDRFIIMDDVELEDITPSRAGLLLAGPHAPEILRRLHLEAAPSSTPAFTCLDWRSAPVVVLRAYSPLIPRFELWSEAATIAELAAEIAGMDVTQCTPATLETLRVLEGTPLFGVDIRDRDLPQETGAVRALHFSKGCYLGQEIVERIHSRGSVHRTFAGFYLAGEDASGGLALSVDDKAVGELTSVVNIPFSTGDAQPQTGLQTGSQTRLQAGTRIGLGYIRREALAGNKPIHYRGGIAHPTSLPFDLARIHSEHQLPRFTPDT